MSDTMKKLVLWSSEKQRVVYLEGTAAGINQTFKRVVAEEIRTDALGGEAWVGCSDAKSLPIFKAALIAQGARS